MSVITLLPSSAVCISILPPWLGVRCPRRLRSLAVFQCPSVERTPEMPPPDRFDVSLRIVCILFLWPTKETTEHREAWLLRVSELCVGCKEQSLRYFRGALQEGGNVHVQVSGTWSFEVKLQELLKVCWSSFTFKRFNTSSETRRRDDSLVSTNTYVALVNIAGKSRVRSPMVSFEYFINIILPAALWPWGLLTF